MRALNFANRNFKELIRDPLGIFFSIVLPIILLIIFKQINVPNDNFKLENFTPSIIIFSFSFITLFTSTLVARDRTNSFLIRLGISPMKSFDFIIGYTLSIIPIIVIQNILFFIAAILLGLTFSIKVLLVVVVSIFISILFIMMGILIGSLLSEKASSGFSSVIVQLVCFTSGMYFPNELLGNVFIKICQYLPFESTVTILKGIMNNINLIEIRNVIVFMFYLILFTFLAIKFFKKNMAK